MNKDQHVSVNVSFQIPPPLRSGDRRGIRIALTK